MGQESETRIGKEKELHGACRENARVIEADLKNQLDEYIKDLDAEKAITKRLQTEVQTLVKEVSALKIKPECADKEVQVGTSMATQTGDEQGSGWDNPDLKGELAGIGYLMKDVEHNLTADDLTLALKDDQDDDEFPLGIDNDELIDLFLEVGALKNQMEQYGDAMDTIHDDFG